MNYTVRFIPVRNGTEITIEDLGIFGVSGSHKVIGFKPRSVAKPEGWLVVLIAQTAAAGKPPRITSPGRKRKVR